jgi:hypothetical protein
MPNRYLGKLLIIVPVTKMANKLANLQTWLSKTTNQDIKILIVHDIADDPTSLELKEIVSKFSRLKIELIEKKLNSPGLARNLGLATVNYEWISFVDSDDLVDVTELLNMISKSPLDAEIVIGNYRVSSSKGTKSMKNSEFIDPKMNVAMNPGIWRMIFRQEVIGLTRFSKYKMGEDQLFLLDIDFFRRKLFFSNLFPYTYFQNMEGQLTSDRKSVKDISNVIKETIQIFNKSDESIQSYVGMITLRQMMTEFKFYICNNVFRAFYQLVVNLKLIKPHLRLTLLKSFFTFFLEMNKSKSKYTYLVLTGGLGNQLFQYTAALSRDASKILVDTNIGKPRSGNQDIPCIFDFELAREVSVVPKKRFSRVISKLSNYLIKSGMNPKGIERTYIYKYLLKISTSIIFSVWYRKSMTVIQAKDNGYFDMREIRGNDLLVGYFQSYVWASDANIKSQLLSLKLKNPSKLLKEFVDEYIDKSVLAIHIRLGDYRDQYEFGLIDESYYANAIELVESEMKIDSIWLFSNEPAEAKKLIPPKFLDKVILVPDFNGSASETLEAMRFANAYIIANSSLSWWGAFLSYCSNPPLIIAPKPWFRLARDPNLIIDPDWRRLSAWEPS